MGSVPFLGRRGLLSSLWRRGSYQDLSGTSLVVQWLGLCSGRGTKILQSKWYNQKKHKKPLKTPYCCIETSVPSSEGARVGLVQRGRETGLATTLRQQS